MSASEADPILIGYDGSPGALRAIETAGAMFPGHKAVVLHVWSPFALIASSYGSAGAMLTYDDTQLREAAEGIRARFGFGVLVFLGVFFTRNTTPPAMRPMPTR